MSSNPDQYTPKQGYQMLLMWAVAFSIFAVSAAIAWIQEANAIFVILPILGAFISIIGYFVFKNIYSHLNHSLEKAEKDARYVRAVEQRSRAVYELSTTLSSTLDYQKVLEAVQTVGILAMYEPDTNKRLVSAALLYRQNDNQLQVISSRRFTLADDKKTVEATSGLLGKAIREGEPAFGNDANNDPDLRYFVGFHNAQSLVAIPLRAGFTNYGVMVFACHEANVFNPATADLLSAIGTQATIALQNAVLYESIRAEKERIVKVEEDARKKFAHDLHDGPTQKVSVISSLGGLLQKALRSGKVGQQAEQDMGKIVDLANKAAKEIRHMIFSLHPLVLEGKGLVAALQEMAKKAKDTYDLNIEVQAQSEVEKYLDDKTQGSLFYIIEEGVNNARKHARAERIIIRMHRRRQDCIIEIEDNGVGFDVAEVVNNDYHKRGSLGMVSMRERAELVDGELHLQSKRGSGTKITIRIPISDDTLSSPLPLGSKKPSSATDALGATRLGAQVITKTEAQDAEDNWANLLK